MSTQNLCFEQKYEKYQNFLSENFPFLVVKFSVYLNRRVFIMTCCRNDVLSKMQGKEMTIVQTVPPFTFDHITKTRLFKYIENFTPKN